MPGRLGTNPGYQSRTARSWQSPATSLADASNLTEIADECRWSRDLAEEGAQLADRTDAWAFQVQLLPGSILQTLGVETGRRRPVSRRTDERPP